jgi:hypothetical protein
VKAQLKTVVEIAGPPFKFNTIALLPMMVLKKILLSFLYICYDLVEIKNSN